MTDSSEWITSGKENVDTVDTEGGTEDIELSSVEPEKETKSVDDLIKERDGLYHDLKNTRNELRRVRQDQEYRDTILQSRLEELENRFGASATKDAEPPDKDDDPVGYLLWQQEQIGRKTEGELQNLRGDLSNINQSTRLSNTITQVRELENKFLETSGTKREEYDKVLDSFRNVTSSILRLQGYNEREIPALIGSIEYNISQSSIAAGMNPAEELYKLLSKSSVISPQAEGNGGREDDANRMRMGLKTSKSLSAAGGGAKGRRITIEDVADMDPDEFSKFANNPRIWQKLNMDGYVDI